MTDTITCPRCGEGNLASSNFCNECGSELEMADRSTPGQSSEVAGALEVESQRSASVSDFANADHEEQSESQGNSTRRPIRHFVHFQTDIGRTHHTNQDSGGAWTWHRPDGSPASLIVVADGVSAGRRSEEASRLAVDIIYGRLAPLLSETEKDVDALLGGLLEAAKYANHEVAKRPHYSLSSADATTLVAALVVGSAGGGVWCGDSRVYRLGDRSAELLTRDHSWAQQVVSAGLLSPQQASRDPRAHMITRWLGPPPQEDPGIETFRFTLGAGEMVMCCTDGLYGYFAPPTADEEGELAGMLAGDTANLPVRVRKVIEMTLERGGRDNISVALVAAADRSRDRDETPLPTPPAPMRDEETTMRLRFPAL